ncbi:MAG: DNA recombination protein RmuC [Stellaceae bacterium]
MDIALIVILAFVAAAALGLWLNRREAQRRVVAETRLAEAERRMADFERLKPEIVQAATAAALATGRELSSKLLEDHKRENAEARKEAEARVKEHSASLVNQVNEIAKAVQELHGQLKDKSRTLDTLWRALSSPGGAGQIAEIGLANTLKSFGLELGRDFVLQQTTQDEDGRRLRPDAVVFLPGDSVLVIDCKASKFLLDIGAAEGTEAEAEAYRNLARTMNLHLRALVEKDYANAIRSALRQAGRGDEIARRLSVMYLPNEAALEKLNRADPEFLSKARTAQIIPAGPAGLHCAVSLASAEINLMRQVENQSRIVEGAEALVESIGAALGHAAQIGKNLKSAAESFSRFAGSVNQRVLPRARKLTALGLQPGKGIPSNLPTYSVTGHEAELIEGEAEEVRDELAAPPTPRLVR